MQESQGNWEARRVRFEKKKVFQLYQHDKKKKKICRSLLQVTATLCRRDLRLNYRTVYIAGN